MGTGHQSITAACGRATGSAKIVCKAELSDASALCNKPKPWLYPTKRVESGQANMRAAELDCGKVRVRLSGRSRELDSSRRPTAAF
jgi:hypothetical protein